MRRSESRKCAKLISVGNNRLIKEYQKTSIGGNIPTKCIKFKRYFWRKKYLVDINFF